MLNRSDKNETNHGLQVNFAQEQHTPLIFFKTSANRPKHTHFLHNLWYKLLVLNLYNSSRNPPYLLNLRCASTTILHWIMFLPQKEDPSEGPQTTVLW